MLKQFLAAGLILAGSPALAADVDLRLGTYGVAFCGAWAEFQLTSQEGDRRVFAGMILIESTGQYDKLTVSQSGLNDALLISRSLDGTRSGPRQTVKTDPPVFENGSFVWRAQIGRGPGCNNPGAATDFRMPRADTALDTPLEPQAPTYEFDQFEVIGQSPMQCESSMALCTNSVQATFGANAPNVIAEKCTPLFQVCMGNAWVAATEYEEEVRVVGKTPGECISSNQRCEARMLGYGTSAPNMIATECAPRLAVCLNEAARTAGGGGGDGDGGGGNRVRITAEVTGYDDAGGGPDKCYLQAGDTADLLGSDPGDPAWKHLQGAGVCDGDDFWIYDDGKLANL
jgi:hypothetical protein